MLLTITFVLSTVTTFYVHGDRSADRAISGDEITRTCGDVCNYENTFTRAHCDYMNLKIIPSYSGCEGATLLELQGNSIEIIPPERIREYHHVKSLDVSWNKISVIEPGLFSGLNSLRNVLFSHNRLQAVLNGVFNGTEESLTRIYFNDNQILTLGDEAFKGLNQVILIDLNNNNIHMLPSKVFHDVTELKDLNLANNNLDHLEQYQFKGLTKLITLSLEGNNLRKLPEGLFDGLESLKEVFVSNNHLITIPAPQNLGLHFGLATLDFQNNYLNQSALVIPYLINATWTVHFNDNPFVCDCYFQSISQNWSEEVLIEETMMTSLTCILPNGLIKRPGDQLPISCSDTSPESTTTKMTNYTTIPTTTSHRVNDRLNTVRYQGDAIFTLQNNKNMTKELTATCNKISKATLIVISIFFSLWVVKSVYYCMVQRKKKRQGRKHLQRNV